MKLKSSNANRSAVVVSCKNDRTEIKVKPNPKGALQGATTGAIIGARFGPIGIATGSLVGGVLGYILG